MPSGEVARHDVEVYGVARKRSNRVSHCVSSSSETPVAKIVILTYHCSNGPSEFNITGPLRDWTVVPDLPKIKASTLLLNGRYDEAQDSVMAPFFKFIPMVKWVTFAESAHMPHLEETERYLETVGAFLKYE
jgi:pimeloyl-ACP methyl ester carboxylesterase